jgi:hypothetical protein
MSEPIAPVIKAAPEFPPTPFLSPRNLPFWAGVTVVVIIFAMVSWLG